METIKLKAHQLIARLKDAVAKQDENRINNLFKKAEQLDWTDAPCYLFEEFNRLVKQGNKILLIQPK